MPETYKFPKRSDANPVIYAYKFIGVVDHEGFIKVGYTTIDVDRRIRQQLPTESRIRYKILGVWPAMKKDGTSFDDHPIHRFLERKGFRRLDNRRNNEWFNCTPDDVTEAVIATKHGIENIENRTLDFGMRPEQKEAVKKTCEYFKSVKAEDRNHTPKFLWNAKMRFGKTFAAYQLAKKMGFKKILILTFKPAVQSAWHDDLMRHIDFEGWQFISHYNMPNGQNENEQYENADTSRPIVCFGSFQDYLMKDRNGEIKAKNEWVHTTNWDLVIFDEYHFGAWRDRAKALFESDEDSYETNLSEGNGDNEDNYDETYLPITTNHYLFLSGTPFRALNSGEFIEEQIYSWTYSDEQRAKDEWKGPGENPYAALPRMVMLAYKMPDEIRKIAANDDYEFDLNLFFSTEGEGSNARFKYEEFVQKWLYFIRGDILETSVREKNLGAHNKPALPYLDVTLLEALTHTLWFMPSVASCHAMKNLLEKRHNKKFFRDYKINVCAGPQAGIGAAALEPVLNSMDPPLIKKTITLTCGKLTTGVTVQPWTGIFMLRNMSSPETYFQAAFRVQSPWEIKKGTGEKEILKKECYIFDFALDRALRQISEYSCNLDKVGRSPAENVGDFIKFLPVLAYDGSKMDRVNAEEILDLIMTGTTATLLAKRWESALLVNVDNETLARVLANEKAMQVLERIEGFRTLNSDITAIINKSNAVQQARRERLDLSDDERRELSKEEKEYKAKRKFIQDKLIKFATRVPVFMYLSDYRENSLRDVITKLEPELFKKVTGLTVKDFELLVSLNLFNERDMNLAVYYFKRYEDDSLKYCTGEIKNDAANVGLYNTVISRKDYESMNKQISSSMKL